MGNHTPVPRNRSNVRSRLKGLLRYRRQLAVASSVGTILLLAWRAVGLQPPLQFLVEHPVTAGAAAVVLVAAALAVWFRAPLLRLLVKGTVEHRFGHLDLTAAEQQFPLYPDLIRIDLRMLRMQTREFARKTGLPLHAAWYISHTPGFFPRPDLVERICEALLTPLERIQTGGGYGPKYTKRRLLRLEELGEVEGWTKEEILNEDDATRATLLGWVEVRLRKELDSTANGWNHE